MLIPKQSNDRLRLENRDLDDSGRYDKEVGGGVEILEFLHAQMEQ